MLLRRVLSRYLPVDPGAWRFGNGPYGRPDILEPVCPLRFSVAHTGGLIVIGVCAGAEVGVDVERRDRGRVPLPVADRWFAPAEAAALRALPVAARRRRFLELWTLKEAYVKARGLGLLAMPLDRFVIDLAGGAPRLLAAADDDPARWRLHSLELGEHLVAVATTASAGLILHDAGELSA